MYSPSQTKERIIFNKTFEPGVLEDTITIVNDSLNKWIINSTTSYIGSNSCYISNNSKDHQYDGSVAQVSHFYFDVKFPRLLSTANLEFDWRCLGEPGFDFLRVSLINPSITPIAGTEIDHTRSIGSSKYQREITVIKGTGRNRKPVKDMVYEYQASPNWRREYIQLDLSGLRNRKRRFVFSWINSADQNTFNPPIAIDNLKVTTVMPIKDL